jgi:hypothetical protein
VDDAGRALDVTVRTQASSASATRPARLLWRAQIDGSHHWWFENRGPKCALLVYIDDATGKLLHLRFYPDGRLEITHEAATLPYRTFDTLRSVHRSEVVENKRLDDMLALVAEMQAGRELRRSGPSRSGQTDHMFGIPDGSQGNGYKKRGTKPAGGRISPTILSSSRGDSNPWRD